MFSTSDTIVAIATPPGRGGIGVVRLSGPDARAIAGQLIATERPLEPRYATFARVRSAAVRRRLEAYEANAIGKRSTHMGKADNAHASNASGLKQSEPYVASGVSRTDGEVIDQAIITYFPAPNSYTGEHVIEISAHGSPVVLQTIVAAAIVAGARLAEPGEFTLRAFLNGRIDLPQAEAVADLIEAVTPVQARAAFDQLQGTLSSAIATIDAELFDLVARLEASIDFPEEGFHFVEPRALAGAIDLIAARVRRLLQDAHRGRLVREGLQIAIVGRPNVGKSSLFNALVGVARAIVTDVPGTTRDLVTETVDLDGLRATMVDSAGLRETSDVVEEEGVRRTKAAAATADLTLVVLDRSVREDAAPGLPCYLNVENKRVIVANKSDLTPAWSRPDAVNVSATTGEGLGELRRQIALALDVETTRDAPAITNIRHITLLERAQRALSAARAALEHEPPLSEEFVLADLQDARAAFEEITGKRAAGDVLAHIFSRFCIGK